MAEHQCHVESDAQCLPVAFIVYSEMTRTVLSKEVR